jgi:hypothetical protein
MDCLKVAVVPVAPQFHVIATGKPPDADIALAIAAAADATLHHSEAMCLCIGQSGELGFCEAVKVG